jgi:hypothetical protein
LVLALPVHKKLLADVLTLLYLTLAHQVRLRMRLPQQTHRKNLQRLAQDHADFYKQELHRLKYFLKFLNGEEGYKWEYTNITSLTMYIRNENLDEIYKKYRLAVLSHRDEGVKVTKNRRHVIYQNLLPKFMPNWSIQDHSHSGFFAFSLTRKK